MNANLNGSLNVRLNAAKKSGNRPVLALRLGTSLGTWEICPICSRQKDRRLNANLNGRPRGAGG